jgi:microcystin-dependent protein
VNQLPSHSHQVQAAQGLGDSALPAGRQLATAEPQEPVYRDDSPDVAMNAAAIQDNPGGQSHANVMPFQCINFIIALFGVYPSRN